MTHKMVNKLGELLNSYLLHKLGVLDNKEWSLKHVVTEQVR